MHSLSTLLFEARDDMCSDGAAEERQESEARNGWLPIVASRTPAPRSPYSRWVKRSTAGTSTVGVRKSLRLRVWRSLASLGGRIRSDSLLRNSLFIMITTIINSVFGFVFWLLAARLFSAHIVGLTAALVSASTIIVLLASLGVCGMLIQSVSAQRNAEEFSLTFWAGTATAVALSLTIVCATIVVLPLIARDLSALNGIAYAVLFLAGTVSMSVGTVLDSVFVAERTAGNMVIRNAVVAASKLLIVVLLILVAGASALDLLGAWAAASVVGLGFGALLLIRQVSVLRPSRPSALARRALGLRSRLAGNQLIGMGGALLPYVVPLLVTERLSPSDNAYFYTTWMMAGIFLVISPAVSLSLFAEGVHSPHELLGKARTALGVIGALLVPCIVGAFVMGGVILSAFGPAYEHHGMGLLRIVLFASIPDAITNVYVALLRVQGRLAVAAGLNMAMGIGILALSWVFLPRIGIIAVGWAFLVMQLCGCVFVVFDLLRSPIITREAETHGHLEPV
jgi:O-antigen/teichoic acid export membrane protein